MSTCRLLRHLLDGVRTEEITRRRHAIMSHFNLPITVVKNQGMEVDPLLKRKLKVYGKESAHTFVDQLFGGQLLSTVICESCHQPYQILEPFMDLSLPVSEDKSPPAISKRKAGGAGVADSLACLAPSSPVQLSKHQLKKDRKAARKGNGRIKRDQQDSSAIPATLPPEESTAVETVPTVVETTEGKKSPPSSVKEDEGIGEDEEAESSASSERDEQEDDDGDDEGGADIEDENEDLGSKNIDDLASKMEKIHVDSIQEDDSISQNTLNCDTSPTATAKKIRSEWTAKSLCTLAVRYQVILYTLSKFFIKILIEIIFNIRLAHKSAQCNPASTCLRPRNF